MRRSILFCSILLILLAGRYELVAQSQTRPGNEGREFLLSFPANWDYQAPFKYVRLYITARTATDVQVFAGNTLVKTVTTVPHGMVSVDLTLAQAQAVSRDDRSPVPNDAVYTNKAVRIVAGDPVVVGAINRITYTSDGVLALPTTALGKEYIVASASDIADGSIQRLPSQYVVTATADETVVTVVNAWDTPNHDAGQSVTITLNRGDVYSAMSKGGRGDLTGTLITATKPVAVLAGQNCTYLPNEQYPACDHLVEMLAPVGTWGKIYHSVPFATRTKGDLYRIFAGEPNAKIYINGTQVAILPNKGGVEGVGWMQFLPPQRELMEFRSDKKIMVMQYNNSQTYDNAQTDPFFLGLLPPEQFVKEALFTVSADYPNNYLNMVTDTNNWFQMEIATGNSSTWERMSTKFPVTLRAFPTVVNGTRYVGTTLQIPPGTYRIRGPQSFGGYIYGMSSYDSYGYPIAGAFGGSTGKIDTSAPRITRSIGCDGTVHATATDYPDVDSLRSNLASITLGAATNYQFGSRPNINPGVTSTADYSLAVIDRSRDARAVVVVTDMNGNVRLDTIFHHATTTTPSPRVVDFGTVNTSASDTFHLRNAGSGTIDISRLTLALGNRGFSIAGPLYGSSRAPGDSIAWVVYFTPVLAGAVSDTLLVTDPCGTTRQTIFRANSSGLTKAIDVSDADFGTVLIDVPVERTIVIRNTMPVNGGNITITGASGPRNSAFSVIGGMPAFPFTLGPDETRTIIVRFDPNDEGLHRDTIFFEHDAPAASGNDNIAFLNGTATFTVDVADNGDGLRLALGPVAPTPVDGGWATLSYMVAEPATVEITLVDAAGRTVQTLLESGRVQPGEHTLRFDASALAAGTYYSRMSVGEKVRSCPVVVR